MLVRFTSALLSVVSAVTAASQSSSSPQKGFAASIPGESIAVFMPDPQYTEEARKARIKGTVRISATILEDGCAHDIKLREPVGYGLDESAVEALKMWRFRKTTRPMHITIEMNFDPYISTTKQPVAPRCLKFVKIRKQKAAQN